MQLERQGSGGRSQSDNDAATRHPKPENPYAQLTIRDTGKGIHPDFLPHVFDYFRQADSATTRQFGGLGLGLAIARQIVELHGGSVWAESQGEGLGATFTVRLPLMKREDGSQQTHPPYAELRTLNSALQMSYPSLIYRFWW